MIKITERGKLLTVGKFASSLERPADVFFPHGLFRSRGLCVDVTIVSAFKDLDRTVSDGAGWTIAEAVRQKRRKYEARVQERGHDFTPFAMNTLGVIDSVAAVPILRRIAKRRRERLSGVSPGQVYNHLRKKLIFAQQQAMGIGLKARLVCECI